MTIVYQIFLFSEECILLDIMSFSYLRLEYQGLSKEWGGGLNISQNSAKRDFAEFVNYLKRAIKSSKNEIPPRTIA